MDGVINIYKEKGYTSFDVVARLRGILHQKRIGHTGTLDPDAEGVLPVCIGSATRACELLTDKDKTYEAILLLGTKTDTQDVTGKVLEQRRVQVSRQQVEEALLSFVGEYMQVPPMYSALRVNGRRLYELAREGKVIERKARKVFIYSINILETELGEEAWVRFEVTCSKGTYIRTLCEDVGEELGCLGCMKSLRRTRVSSFPVQESLRLTQVEEYCKQGVIADYILPVERMFLSYPALVTRQECDRLLHNGNKLLTEDFSSEIEEIQARYRVYDSRGSFYALYEYRQEEHCFRNVKMFVPTNACSDTEKNT